MAASDIYAAYDDGDQTKEPGALTGTKFHDVMPDSGAPGVRLAARLCNFPTNQTGLRMSHLRWLDDYVQPLIRSLTGPWVDLIGYASQLGSSGTNYMLSVGRAQKVKDWISNYSSSIHWNVQWPKGDTESGRNDAGTQNDGWWRAVTVCVYGYKPPTATPTTMGGFKDFEVKLVGAGSLSPGDFIDVPFPTPSFSGFVFEITALKHGKRIEKAYFAHKGSALSVYVPLIPGVGVGASATRGGGSTPFQTSVPVELSDFQGLATVYQDPGISALGGSLRLSMQSNALAALGATLRPSIVRIDVNSDYLSGFSIAFGVPGTLTMWGTTKPL